MKSMSGVWTHLGRQNCRTGGSSRCSLVPSLVSLTTAELNTHAQEKLDAKEMRRARYKAQQERLERLETRRKDRPRFAKKNEFRTWYDKRRDFHEMVDRKARREGKPWKIEVAVVVERLPLMLPDIEPWEKDFMDLQEHLSQFSWNYPSDLATVKTSTDDDNDYAYNDEMEQGLPNETEVETTDDITSLNRNMKKRIFFAERGLGASSWEFPKTFLQNDETLSDAAMRLAKEKLGDEVALVPMSDCPVAVDLTLNHKKDDLHFGTKTFFMKIQYSIGDVKPDGATTYGWLDRTELTQSAQAVQALDKSKLYHYML